MHANVQPLKLHRNCARLCEMRHAYSKSPPLYLPDPAEVGGLWRQELEGNLKIIEVAPDDALAALRREALRTPPARNGTGARDSAIWLTALRAHLRSDEPTYLVSSNTADFASGDKSVLHPYLMTELGEKASTFHYYSNIPALLASFAEEVAISDVPEFDELLAEDLLSQLLADKSLAAQFSIHGLGTESLTSPVTFQNLEVARALKAFSVDGRTLALFEFNAVLHVGEFDSRAVPLRGRMWADLTPDASSIEEITLDSLQNPS